MEETIMAGNLQGNVIIDGPVDHAEVPKYIEMCDAGIIPIPPLPYWKHQCPIKLLEYLAMGKAVIATDMDAIREVVGDSKCTIYLSSTGPTGIAQAIMYAYDNRVHLKKWGSYGRKIVEDRHSWEKVARDLEDCLLTCKTPLRGRESSVVRSPHAVSDLSPIRQSRNL
jgi:glycosyltransferase involved in cell wall biosynthesis